MKREAKKLLSKATDSLILAIEHFNRPNEVGRATASLIFLDHAMEMFLKAAIVEHKGDIDNKDKPGQKIGFDACVGRCLSDGKIRFLTEEQAKLLRMINGQRDAIQHYLVDLSEQVLYLHLQSGVILFRDMLRTVFKKDLTSYLPDRVLPISTSPPLDFHILFDQEINAVKQMLSPGNRQKIDAEARLRSLIIMDKALIGGDVQQPNVADTRKREKELLRGLDWQNVFPGVASVQIRVEQPGYIVNLIVVKRGTGIPVYIVDGEQAVNEKSLAIQRINDFDRYSLMQKTLAEHLGITSYQTQALTWILSIKNNKDMYKEFKRGATTICGYSQDALHACRERLKMVSIEEICIKYKTRLQKRKSK